MRERSTDRMPASPRPVLARPILPLAVATATVLLASAPLVGLVWFTAVQAVTSILAFVILLLVLRYARWLWAAAVAFALLLLQPIWPVAPNPLTHSATIVASTMLLLSVGLSVRAPKRRKRERPRTPPPQLDAPPVDGRVSDMSVRRGGHRGAGRGDGQH